MKERANGSGITRIQALAARNRILGNLSVTERSEELAGVTTTMLEGGDGPPLVLLHGQGASALAWLPVLPRLLAGHRVIVPDLPGLGESNASDNELDAEGMVSWLGELIAKTCDAPPTIVGLSLGGTIAAHYAVQHGDTCRRIVLVDSGSLGPFRPDPRVLPALIRVQVSPTPRNIERFFGYTVVDLDGFKTRMGDKWQDFVGYGQERNTTASVKSANRQLLRRLGTKQIPDSELGGIACPVALIWGRQDRIMKVQIAENAASRFGWPLQVIEDCGHVSCWDQPDTFAEALETLMAA